MAVFMQRQVECPQGDSAEKPGKSGIYCNEKILFYSSYRQQIDMITPSSES